MQTSLSTVRGQHAIDLGELEDNRRRLRDLAARINHLEETNADLGERAKGLNKDMVARSEQENQEVRLSSELIDKTSPRLPRKRSMSRACWKTMRSRWRITRR